MQDFVTAWKTGKPHKHARIRFPTPELLWKVLTAKRWELLMAMCGAGPLTVRDAAKRVSETWPIHPLNGRPASVVFTASAPDWDTADATGNQLG